MSDNKSINNKDKSYCDEEEKIILNVNLTGLANSNDVSNSTTIITNALAGLSSHLDTTLATLATSTDVSNSTTTITEAINAIPACDLTGLATSTDVSNSTTTITEAINAIPACDLTGLATSENLTNAVAGLSTHLDGTLSEVAKTSDLDVLAKTSDIAGLSSELANNTTSIISTFSNTESNILGALSTCCEETQAGISNVASLVQGLYNNACLIKALARTTAAMTPLYKNCNTMGCIDGNDCGIFRDNLSGTKFEFLNGCTTVTGSSIPAMLEITMESAQQSMFDFITNPENWIGFSC